MRNITRNLITLTTGIIAVKSIGKLGYAFGYIVGVNSVLKRHPELNDSIEHEIKIKGNKYTIKIEKESK